MNNNGPAIDKATRLAIVLPCHNESELIKGFKLAHNFGH